MRVLVLVEEFLVVVLVQEVILELPSWTYKSVVGTPLCRPIARLLYTTQGQVDNAETVSSILGDLLDWSPMATML